MSEIKKLLLESVKEVNFVINKINPNFSIPKNPDPYIDQISNWIENKKDIKEFTIFDVIGHGKHAPYFNPVLANFIMITDGKYIETNYRLYKFNETVSPLYDGPDLLIQDYKQEDGELPPGCEIIVVFVRKL